MTLLYIVIYAYAYIIGRRASRRLRAGRDPASRNRVDDSYSII